LSATGRALSGREALLVETDWLFERLDGPRVRVLEWAANPSLPMERG
jgi:hypothetical protein